MTRRKGPALYQEKPYASIREVQSGDRDGNLTADSPLEGWLRPAGVRLEDGWLVREWFVDRNNDLPTEPNRTLLDGFLKLANAKNERIRAYAERWGLLFDMEREPTTVWRRWAKTAETVLTFANELHRGMVPSDELRVALAEAHLATGGVQISGLGSWPSRAEFRERANSGILAREVNRWLGLGPSMAVFRWDQKGDPEVRLRARSLFSALALELASAAAASELTIGQPCSACGRYFQAKRRSERYCPREVCQKRAAADRAKAYRSRRAKSRNASHDASQTVRTLPDMARRSEGKRPA